MVTGGSDRSGLEEHTKSLGQKQDPSSYTLACTLPFSFPNTQHFVTSSGQLHRSFFFLLFPVCVQDKDQEHSQLVSFGFNLYSPSNLCPSLGIQGVIVLPGTQRAESSQTPSVPCIQILP